LKKAAEKRSLISILSTDPKKHKTPGKLNAFAPVQGKIRHNSLRSVRLVPGWCRTLIPFFP
jgi:hypothetical protein